MRIAKGVTLVELVIAIVIISIAVAGLMAGYSSTMSRSADPLVYQQSIAIAEAMMEEVSGKPFLDPSGSVCPAPPADRSNFNNVCDYNGFTMASITDLAGNSLGLPGYSLVVTVAAPDPSEFDGLTSADALRIDIDVINPLNTITLTGYRTRY